MGAHEITKLVSAEWKQLDDYKKKQFCVSDEVQKELRRTGKINDVQALRDVILDNLSKSAEAQQS